MSFTNAEKVLEKRNGFMKLKGCSNVIYFMNVDPDQIVYHGLVQVNWKDWSCSDNKAIILESPTWRAIIKWIDPFVINTDHVYFEGVELIAYLPADNKFPPALNVVLGS